MSLEIKNKKASFTYFLEDEFTAGIQLNGCEIKSIRNGKASIAEAYCKMEKGEMWVINMHVEIYPNGGYTQQNPRRARKLLLTKTEIKKLDKKLKNVGITIVLNIASFLFIRIRNYVYENAEDSVVVGLGNVKVILESFINFLFKY